MIHKKSQIGKQKQPKTATDISTKPKPSERKN